MKREIINNINILAKENEPFLFVINYDGDDAYIRRLKDIDPKECLYDFEGISNVVLNDGYKHPLLQGTKRAQLLEAGIIEEADLTPEDLKKAEKVSLFNAMIDFGEREVEIQRIL